MSFDKMIDEKLGGPPSVGGLKWIPLKGTPGYRAIVDDYLYLALPVPGKEGRFFCFRDGMRLGDTNGIPWELDHRTLHLVLQWPSQHGVPPRF